MQAGSPGPLQPGRSQRRAGRGGPSGVTPERVRGWVGKAASRGAPASPSTPSLPRSQRSPPGPPFQSPLRPPRGSVPRGLAMSQPGQKPAASPRPRRAAAARHTQEVSGTCAGAAGLSAGRTPAPEPWAASLGVALLACCPVRPLPSLRRTWDSEPASGQVTGGGWVLPGLGQVYWARRKPDWSWPALGKVD